MARHSIYKVFSKRISSWDESFQEFARRICKEEMVLEAYLIGSRAHGDYLPYSDYDVVVIVSREVDKLEATIRLRMLRGEKVFPLDLIVLYEDEASDPLYSNMLKNKVVLCSKRS